MVAGVIKISTSTINDHIIMMSLSPCRSNLNLTWNYQGFVCSGLFVLFHSFGVIKLPFSSLRLLAIFPQSIWRPIASEQDNEMRMSICFHSYFQLGLNLRRQSQESSAATGHLVKPKRGTGV